MWRDLLHLSEDRSWRLRKRCTVRDVEVGRLTLQQKRTGSLRIFRGGCGHLPDSRSKRPKMTGLDVPGGRSVPGKKGGQDCSVVSDSNERQKIDRVPKPTSGPLTPSGSCSRVRNREAGHLTAAPPISCAQPKGAFVFDNAGRDSTMQTLQNCTAKSRIPQSRRISGAAHPAHGSDQSTTWEKRQTLSSLMLAWRRLEVRTGHYPSICRQIQNFSF